MKRQTVFAMAISMLLLVVGVQVRAGSVVSWGETAFNSGDFSRNDFVAIDAGGFISIALKSDGSIIGWGDNRYGQAEPPDGNDFVAIAAGDFHSLALKSDGSIVGWGDNDRGRADPPDGNDFVAIAAGWLDSLALIELPPVELPMRITPQAINCHSRGKWLKAHFVLAEGFSSGDVDTGTAAWIEALGIESQYINVSGNKGGVVKIEIGFDRAEACAALDSGSVELTVVGSLASGRQFYGTDTIKVID